MQDKKRGKVVFTISEFWKWETVKGLLVLMMQRSSGHIRLLFAL